MQEQIAERANLAVDMIRNLEHSRFSPGVETLRKLAHGSGHTPAALLTKFEAVPASSGEMAVLTISRGSDPLTARRSGLCSGSESIV